MPVTPFLQIDQQRINPRRIQTAVQVLSRGGVIAYPTDTVYALGCAMRERKAVERLYRIKRLEPQRHLSFICENISQISEFACVDQFAFRWLKKLLPGPYTVILPALRSIPKVVLQKRKEVGVRVPDHAIVTQLVEQLGQPIVTTSASDPDTRELMIDAEIVRERLGKHLDLIIDGGVLTHEPSTVISLVGDQLEVLREGKGEVVWP